MRVDTEGHASELHSAVEVLRREERPDVDVLRVHLFLTKTLPVLVRNIVELYPTMANVLTLELVESVLRIFFSFKEAGCLPSHLTVLISTQLDRVLNELVAVEERVYVINLD